MHLSDGSKCRCFEQADFSAWEEQAHGIASPEIPEALRGNPAYAPKPNNALIATPTLHPLAAMKMKRFLLTALVLAVLSAAAWRFRQQELETLRAESARAPNSAPNQTRRGRRSLRNRPRKLTRRKWRDCGRCGRNWRACAGSIGALRARTNQTPEQLHAQAEKVREEATLIRARFDARGKIQGGEGRNRDLLDAGDGLAVDDGELCRRLGMRFVRG